jgi:hypothetical protein
MTGRTKHRVGLRTLFAHLGKATALARARQCARSSLSLLPYGLQYGRRGKSGNRRYLATAHGTGVCR